MQKLVSTVWTEFHKITPFRREFLGNSRMVIVDEIEELGWIYKGCTGRLETMRIVDSTISRSII